MKTTITINESPISNESPASTISSDSPTYKVRCSCCGKVFITSEPKQDLCIECMNELADYLALDY